jgi:tetratricopeptide (TPR) repeat protein
MIKAPAGTVIWVDRLRYGKVTESGTLPIKNLSQGQHFLRARLSGKQEATQTFTNSTSGPREVTVKLSLPAGKAEARFQAAEELRESGKHKEAIKEYRAALALSKRGYAAARIGLSRSLLATEEYEKAVAEGRSALRDSGGRSAEAFTVIANTRRFQGLYDQAIVGYQTALEQARNVSPEAHTGLALTYQERNRADDAIKHYRIACEQSKDTEPVIYFLLGGRSSERCE